MNNNSVALVSVLLAVAGGLWLWHRSALRRSNIPFVPYWIPFLGSSISFSQNAVDFLNACQNKYGPVFQVLLMGKCMTFFTSPKHYNTILRTKTLSHVPVFEEIERNTFGQSKEFTTFRNDTTTKDSQANEFNKLFTRNLIHKDAVATLVERTYKEQRLVLSALKAKSYNVSLLRFIEESLIVSATNVMLGDSTMNNHPSLVSDFLSFDATFPLFVADCVPSMFLKNGIASRDRLISLLSNVNFANASSLMQQRAHVLKSFPCGTPQDKASTHLEMIWAANANSIPTTFWTFYHLLKHPQALAAVKQEISEHLEYHSLSEVDTPWTSEMLQKCVLLDSVVDESLRISASSILLRIAIEPTDLVVDNTTYHFEKGDRVALFPTLGQFDPVLFPNPNEFQYDRFVNATQEQLEAFKPFGMGVSMCPGRYFAKNQIKMFVALVLQHLPSIKLVPGYKEPIFDPSRLGLGVIPPADHSIEIEFTVDE